MPAKKKTKVAEASEDSDMEVNEEQENKEAADSPEKAADKEGGKEKKEEKKDAGDAPDEAGEDEDGDEVDDEEVKPEEPEKPKEPEEDAPEDHRPRVQAPVCMSDLDCSLNAAVSSGGAVINSLCAGSFQHMLCGVRATTGMKSGRYLFEVKVLEKMQGEAYLRVGVATASAPLYLDNREKEQSYFEARPHWAFKVIGVLVNLDANSPNAFTMSLFVDGVRDQDPVPIPENLKGVGLFPMVTFKNISLLCNLGQAGSPQEPLPFKARMLGDIAVEDSVEGMKAPAGGKHEVVFPIGLPEGIFDWVEQYIETNPEFTELSDRSFHKWCKQSGLKKPWGDQRQEKDSVDKPNFNFGIKDVDNRSWRKMLFTISKFTKKNFIVMEAKANLLKESREEMLKKFSAPHFTKTAVVAIGEPPEQFKSWVHKTIMDRHEKKKEALIAKMKRRQGGKKKKDDEEEKEPEVDIKEPEIGDDVKFLPKQPKNQPDISKDLINQSFSTFSIPTLDEGFDAVKFVWADESAAAEYLKKWQLDLKATTIIPDLKPSDWFKEKMKAWKEAKVEYKKKLSEWKTKASKEKKDDEDEGVDVADVTDVHSTDEAGTPLYAKFSNEDWTIFHWRYEMHLLAHGFKHDVDDPDRPGVPEEHIAHYYKLFLETAFHAKALGCNNLAEVCDLLKDTVKLAEKAKILTPLLPEDTEIDKFVKMTEEARRTRVRRIEAGDESARLKIPKNFVPADESKGGNRERGSSKGGGKGKDKGKKREREHSWGHADRSAKWQRNDKGSGKGNDRGYQKDYGDRGQRWEHKERDSGWGGRDQSRGYSSKGYSNSGGKGYSSKGHNKGNRRGYW